MSETPLPPFDYGVLTKEQARRTQEAEYRIIGRTQKLLIENGKDLLAVKADIGHGHFLNWIQSLGISESTAESWMSVAEKFDEIPTGWEFENHALYLLCTSKVPETARQEAIARAQAGEKITEEVARTIREAHRDREDAERKSQLLSRQLQRVEQEVATLQRQLAEKPKIIEKIVENPQTKAALAELQEQYAQKEEALRQKTERIKVLTDEINRYGRIYREDNYNEQVRSRWRQACDAFHLRLHVFSPYLSLIRWLGKPIDRVSFVSLCFLLLLSSSRYRCQIRCQFWPVVGGACIVHRPFSFWASVSCF